MWKKIQNLPRPVVASLEEQTSCKMKVKDIIGI